IDQHPAAGWQSDPGSGSDGVSEHPSQYYRLLRRIGLFDRRDSILWLDSAVRRPVQPSGGQLHIESRSIGFGLWKAERATDREVIEQEFSQGKSNDEADDTDDEINPANNHDAKCDSPSEIHSCMDPDLDDGLEPGGHPDRASLAARSSLAEALLE